MPKASIIITTYNRSKLMQERALKSALAQAKSFGRDYEILVIDHGSNDGTYDLRSIYENQISLAQILYYPKVRFIRIEKNSGIVSTARNRGAKEAKGEYIVFLDDDNELMPDYLSKVVPVLDAADDMSAVSVGRIVKHSGYEHFATPYRSDLFGHERFISLDWGWLIRRSVFDVIQYDEQMFFNEDADFGLQFTERFAFTNLNEPLTIAYAHEEGESHSSPNPRMIKAMDYFCKKNGRFYKDQPNELRYLYRLIGRRCYMVGLKRKGIGYFWRSFWAMKNWRTFKHFFFILLGWKAYNDFMVREEKKYV